MKEYVVKIRPRYKDNQFDVHFPPHHEDDPMATYDPIDDPMFLAFSVPGYKNSMADGIDVVQSWEECGRVLHDGGTLTWELHPSWSQSFRRSFIKCFMKQLAESAWDITMIFR